MSNSLWGSNYIMIKHSVQTHLFVSTEGHFEVLVGVMPISICEWTTTLIFLDHELVHHFDGTGIGCNATIINATTALVLLQMLNCQLCVILWSTLYLYLSLMWEVPTYRKGKDCHSASDLKT
jgi:hypothetical protein